jgi:hypothetical protein
MYLMLFSPLSSTSSSFLPMLRPCKLPTLSTESMLG